MIFQSFLTWLIFLLILFFNSTIRDRVVDPQIGTNWAQGLSTVILSVATLAITGILVSLGDISGKVKLFLIGFGWALLTILFEWVYQFLFLQRPMEHISPDNLLLGRYFYVILIIQLTAPQFTSSLLNRYLK